MDRVVEREVSARCKDRPAHRLGAPLRVDLRIRPNRRHLLLALAIAVAGATALTCVADQLPTRLYDSSDGLPGDSGEEMIVDREGYIWTSSADLLTRFDGLEFEQYGPESGLRASTQGLAQTPDGTIWIGTRAGLQYFGTSGEPAIRSLSIDSPIAHQPIVDLGVLPSGDLVVPLVQGEIYVVSGAPAQPTVTLLSAGRGADDSLFTIDCDAHGTVWAAHHSGVLRRIAANGQVDEFRLNTPPETNSVRHSHVDRFGHLWTATWNGLFVGDANAKSAAELFARRVDQIAGRPILFATGVIEIADGSIVVAAGGGLLLIKPLADLKAPLSAEWIAKPEGLDAVELDTVREDSRHNLWVTDTRRGLWHIALDGVRRVSEPQRLHDAYIKTLQRLAGGMMLAIGNRLDSGPSEPVLQLWDGKSWSEHPYPRPRREKHLGWGWNQIVAIDARGSIWFASGHGLLGFRPGTRLQDLEYDRPDFFLTSKDGLPAGELFRVWLDGQGLLNLVYSGAPSSAPVRFDPIARTVLPTRIDHWPDSETPLPVAFAADARGATWIAIRRGIGRPLAPGHWEYISLPDGPDTKPPATLCATFDSAGALWVGSNAGLFRAERPLDPAPRFERIWPREPSPPRAVEQLLALPDRSLLLATSAGVVLLGRDTAVAREFGVASGLPSVLANALALDPLGRVWVGTARGIAILPALGGANSPPVPDPLLVRIATPLRNVPLDRRNQAVYAKLDLQPIERSLDISVRAIQTQPDLRIFYRTRLEGIDRDWSPPTANRQLRIAGLSPGSYRLRIRAEDQTGAVSAREARIDFTVGAEFYERPWFFAVAIGALALSALAWQRQAAQRRLAIERTRTAIATDLHDDVGAGLSQIAVLSEKLARERGSHIERAADDGSQTQIAEIARRLVDRMSDLVWAINPERDRVFSLGQRMRQFATPILRARGVALQLTAVDEEHDRALSGEVRRELLLAFQEIVTNAAKHSACTRVDAALAIEAGRIVLTVADDGQGFDPAAAAEGTGLGSIRKRAERLGGSCRIASNPGGGVTVQIAVPQRR